MAHEVCCDGAVMILSLLLAVNFVTSDVFRHCDISVNFVKRPAGLTKIIFIFIVRGFLFSVKMMDDES